MVSIKCTLQPHILKMEAQNDNIEKMPRINREMRSCAEIMCSHAQTG